MEERTEAVAAAVAVHGHDEYSLTGHSHPEYDHSERFALIESRIENIEHGLEERIEEPVVEEIEPTPEPAAEPKTPERRKYSFGSRR